MPYVDGMGWMDEWFIGYPRSFKSNFGDNKCWKHWLLLNVFCHTTSSSPLENGEKLWESLFYLWTYFLTHQNEEQIQSLRLYFELIDCILIHRDLYEALLLLRLLLFGARFFKRFPLRWDLGSIMMIQNIHIARSQNSLRRSKKAESAQIKIESWCEKETNPLQTFPRKQPATCSPSFC